MKIEICDLWYIFKGRETACPITLLAWMGGERGREHVNVEIKLELVNANQTKVHELLVALCVLRSLPRLVIVQGDLKPKVGEVLSYFGLDSAVSDSDPVHANTEAAE